MNTKKMIAIACAALMGCTGITAGYKVSGKVDNNGGARIYLVTKVGQQYVDTLATSLTPDGSFSFAGELSTPVPAVVLSDGSRVHVPVMLEDGADLKVSVSADKPVAWKVSGAGQLQSLRNEFQKLEDSYRHNCDSVETYYRNNYDLNDYFWKVQLKGAMQQEREKFDVERDRFVAANDNLVGAAVLAADIRKLVSDKTVDKKYLLLGENARNTAPGKLLEKEAARISRIVVGGKAPDFTMPTPDGSMLTLYDVKAKVKIVDFWASWCGPCRAENPTLRKIYAEYAPKGLEIISFSIDTDKDAWTKAIKDDNMVWKHVCELGQGNTASYIYNIFAVPRMFILDENNNIISEGLRGQALIDFVAERFK